MSASDNKEADAGDLRRDRRGRLPAAFGGDDRGDDLGHQGLHAFSKVYAGKEAIQKRLLGPLVSRIDGKITLAAGRLIAEDDLVVVEARGNSVTTDGVPYNNSYCFIFRLEGGKIREITEYIDTQLVMNAFGRPAGAAARTG